jgi:CRISPR-associated protein Csm2
MVYGRKFISDDVKTNQLRNFYSSIISIRTNLKSTKEVTAQIERELILLKPKLAYAAGRQPKVKPFYELMKNGIDATIKVTDPKQKKEALENLISITEAIVAYHKFFDKKSNF